MSDHATHELLIARLARDLRPVAPLAPPWQRAAAWLVAAVWVGVLLSLFADFPALRARLMAAPDMWLSLLGAALTAILAGWAALQTSVPGRSALCALVPSAIVHWALPSTGGGLRRERVLPLLLLLTWQVRRAFPLRPGLTACLAGLASAGAGATLLALIHPFDATGEDLGLHFVGVVIIVALGRFGSGKSKEGLLF